MMQDVRYAARTLLKSPLFLAAAIFSLGIGIAANTTVFSVINAIVLAPPAVRDPGSLVTIYTSDFSGPRFGTSSYPDFTDFRARGALEDLAAYRRAGPLVAVGDSVERAQVVAVTGNYFSLLGVSAAIGRTFVLNEPLAPGADPFIVLSHSYWRRRFAADPAIVGRTINLNGQPFGIIGILPQEFTGVERGSIPDAWIPLSMSQGLDLQQRGSRALRLIGRLKTASSVEQVRAEFEALAAQLQDIDARAWTDRNNERRVITVLSEADSRVPPRERGAVLGGLALILSVMALVLLMACVNVASLQLARAVGRQREIAIRLSLGARRLRVFRQLLIESLLLALSAGTLGFLLSVWAMNGLDAAQSTFDLPMEFVFHDRSSSNGVRDRFVVADRPHLWRRAGHSVFACVAGSNGERRRIIGPMVAYPDAERVRCGPDCSVLSPAHRRRPFPAESHARYGYLIQGSIGRTSSCFPPICALRATSRRLPARRLRSDSSNGSVPCLACHPQRLQIGFH